VSQFGNLSIGDSPSDHIVTIVVACMRGTMCLYRCVLDIDKVNLEAVFYVYFEGKVMREEVRQRITSEHPHIYLGLL